MNYKYISEKNFEDLASGRVLYHRTGYPNFPARLAGEMFMNCLEIAGKTKEKVVLYDPCCGGAYMMTVLGFLCGNHIKSIYASDISEEAAALAVANLNLLRPEGLLQRKAQLEKLYAEYNKPSHQDAIVSAKRLLRQLERESNIINYSVFSADCMDTNSLKAKGFKADIVFTDVPYGNLVSWSEETTLAIDKLLDTMIPILKANSVIAVASDKKQKISNPQFIKLRKIQVGKRRIVFLKKASGDEKVVSSVSSSNS